MRAVARKVGATLGSDRLPAAPRSSENSRGPEVLRPRLTAGLPLSAIGREAAVHRDELDRHRNHSLLGSPTSRGRHSPVRRVRRMVIRARGTSANLSQIGDSLDQMREYVRKPTRRDPASIDRADCLPQRGDPGVQIGRLLLRKAIIGREAACGVASLLPYPDRSSVKSGAPGRSRTCDLPLRRRSLYPLSYRGICSGVWRRGAERKNGGAEGDRTLDLRIANATLSQLSYRPTRGRAL